jgi:uncharacterized membrane protein
MPSRDLVSRLLIERHGSQNGAIGSILFVWLNLSLLMAFGWASLVLVFDAPAIGIEVLPIDMYVIRLSIILTAAVVTVILWRSSDVPNHPMSMQSVDGLFQRNVFWTQGMLFLIGVTLVLSAFLLMMDVGQATKLLLFGVVEVFAIQALLAGYVKTAMDALLSKGRSFLLVTGLFAVFFACQSLAIAVSTDESGQNYFLAFSAGAFLGLIVGAISLFLRDRAVSILPGFLVQLMVFYLFIPFLE